MWYIYLTAAPHPYIQPPYKPSTDMGQGPYLVYIKFMGEELTHSH
jgi:hypothetical protein